MKKLVKYFSEFLVAPFLLFGGMVGAQSQATKYVSPRIKNKQVITLSQDQIFKGKNAKKRKQAVLEFMTKVQKIDPSRYLNSPISVGVMQYTQDSTNLFAPFEIATEINSIDRIRLDIPFLIKNKDSLGVIPPEIFVGFRNQPLFKEQYDALLAHNDSIKAVQNKTGPIRRYYLGVNIPLSVLTTKTQEGTFYKPVVGAGLTVSLPIPGLADDKNAFSPFLDLTIYGHVVEKEHNTTSWTESELTPDSVLKKTLDVSVLEDYKNRALGEAGLSFNIVFDHKTKERDNCCNTITDRHAVIIGGGVLIGYANGLYDRDSTLTLTNIQSGESQPGVVRDGNPISLDQFVVGYYGKLGYRFNKLAISVGYHHLPAAKLPTVSGNPIKGKDFVTIGLSYVFKTK